MATYHGVTVVIEIERLAAEGVIPKEYIGTLDGSAANQTFYTKNLPITWDAGEAGAITGTAVAAGATDTIFKTDLTPADDYYNGMTIRFTAGPNIGEMRVISTFVQVDGVITVTVAFTGAPGADAFVIEPSVNVYTDDGTVGSWTEYLEDGTDYTIAGPTGAVTILAAENQAGNSGERISIDYYYQAEVGMGQGATIETSRDLVTAYKLGDEDPQEIKGGKVAVKGHLDELYASRDLFGKILGESDFYNKLADFTTRLYPNKKTSGQPRITVSNMKGSMVNLAVDIDTLIASGLDFEGLVLTLDTVP